MAAATKGQTPPSREHVVLGVLFRFGIALLVAGAIVTVIFVYVVPSFNQIEVPLTFNNLYTFGDVSKMHKLSEESQEKLFVLVIVPKSMQVGISSTVQVLFTPQDNLSEWSVFYARNAVAPNKKPGPTTANREVYNLYYTTVQVQPTSKATGSSFANFFGTGYDLTAVASLSAPPSDIAAISPGEQSLEQYAIIWEWTVTPKIAGQQILSLSINAMWKPHDTNTHMSMEARQLAVIDASTKVTAPILFPFLQSLLTGISQGVAGLGAALAGTSTIAFLFKFLSDRLGQRKKGGGADVPANDAVNQPEDKPGGEGST
jgi:hypothetical protein